MRITSAATATATGATQTSGNDGDGDYAGTGTGTWTYGYNAATGKLLLFQPSAILYASQSQSNTSSATSTASPSLNNTLNFHTPTATATPSSTPSSAPVTTTASLSSVWIAGPVMGSILGMSTVFVVIFFTRRKQRSAPPDSLELPSALSSPTSKEFPHSHASSNRSSSNPTPPPDIRVSAPPGELECSEIHELPAVEPVGSEMYTPRDVPRAEGEGGREEWPLPLSPLPLLFAMSELRDERAGLNDSPRHETFYHP
jgi:hypothetical protein